MPKAPLAGWQDFPLPAKTGGYRERDGGTERRSSPHAKGAAMGPAARTTVAETVPSATGARVPHGNGDGACPGGHHHEGERRGFRQYLTDHVTKSGVCRTT